MKQSERFSTRRRLLAGAAGLGAAGVLAAAGAETKPVRLALTEATTEGPFYFDPKLMRADITEGVPGVPLDVRFSVLDPEGRPHAGARVDIWHCDVAGVYSGYGGQGDERALSARGKTFLRGHLMTDANGVAAFRSVYPGWYPGRATHIHFKVFQGLPTVLTSQFFLPDALSQSVYAQLPAYQHKRLRRTLNSDDGIALQAGAGLVGAVREEAGRHAASLTVVVARA